MGEKLTKITLYKILQLPDDEELGKYDQISSENYEGFIRYEAKPIEKDEENVPWLGFLNSTSEKKYEYKAKNKYPRAVLVLKVKISEKYIFYAVCFGQNSSSFLPKDLIVRDFGIKVGMNICDQNKLRKIQTSMHESVTKHTERQVSAGIDLSEFGIDRQSELLRAISGHVILEYEHIIDSFKAKESLSLKFTKSNPLTESTLVDLCKKFENLYYSERYKNTDFKNIYDNLRPETDPKILEQLNEKLCYKIAQKDFSKIHMAYPDFQYVDSSYCYKRPTGKNPKTFDDLVFLDFASANAKKLDEVDIQKLKKWKIYAYDHEKQTYEELSVYKCLIAEIDIETGTYIFSNGAWKEFSEDLKREISIYFEKNDLLKNYGFLPDNVNVYNSNKKQNREDIYNIKSAKDSPKLFLFDKSRNEIAGEKKYEVCDLLSDNGDMIHVKKYTSGSASLSHLFIQAKFYARAFSTEEICRENMRKWIEKNTVPENFSKKKEAFKNIIPIKNNEVSEKDFTVVFCILHSGKVSKISDLPLMCQYELMNCHKFLTEDRKFRVSVVFREVTSEDSEVRPPCP